ERVVAVSPGPEIDVRDLPEAIRKAPPRRVNGTAATGPAAAGAAAAGVAAQAPYALRFDLNHTREKVEIQRIVEALKKHKNNSLRAAAELGISRMGLYKKLRKYGLMNASSAG